MQRLKATGIKKVVIGISGGLDSTLALLVCTMAFKKLNYDTKDIIAITMPCFGTTSRTKNNALGLMEELAVTSIEVDITESVRIQFRDIEQDENIHDVTYENVVGPYELHDFFIYHMVRFGDEPRKLYRKTKLAFKDKYDKETIKKWLTKFYWRFFSQQFKRSCIPDGPKVGSVSLSPRGDWRMPSDANVSNWIDEIEKI